MNGSIPAMIFYLASLAVLFSGFFCYPKTKTDAVKSGADGKTGTGTGGTAVTGANKTRIFYGMTWLPLTGILIECYNAFVAAILNLIHIPTNLFTIGLFDLAAGAFFWFRIKKTGQKQSYRWNWYDLIFAILLVGSILMIAARHYGLPELGWNYRTVDPSARYREAMEFVNNQGISRMFFAQLQNGTVVELFRPFLRYDYYYKLYVLSDILQIILSGAMFYGAVRPLTERTGKRDHFVSVFSVIFSFFYLFGYPLNSTLYGFTYLGMILYLTLALFVVADLFLSDDGSKKWFLLILLSLLCHAYFQCYVLFMPVAFLALGLAILKKQQEKKKLFSVDTLVTLVIVFVPAIVLGLVYTYMDVFVNDNVAVGDAFSAEGAIYRDLYSNFVFFAPVAVIGLIRLWKTKKNRLLSWFAPIFLLFMAGMFVVSYKTGKISTYYFFKDYYLLWLLVFVLMMVAVSHLTADGRKVMTAYLCSWTFVAIMFLTGLESRIEGHNPLFVPDHKSQRYNDLLCFNWNTLSVPTYSEDKMDLIHYVYEHLTAGGESTTEVPVVTRQEETYLFESMTGQRLEDFEFWRGPGHHDAFLENVQDCDYVCVYTDSALYEENQKMFDSWEVVYSTPAGYIARNVK